MKKLEQHLFDWLESHETKLGKFFGYLLVFLIMISTVFFILETTSLNDKYGKIFHAFDFFVMIVFAIEYFFRYMIAPRKLKFVTSLLGIIDAIVLFAFFANFSHLILISFSNLVFLRSFRILRIFQILKIIRYSEVTIAFLRSFRYYRDEIRIFSMTLFLVLIMSSSGLYYLEKETNPEMFGTIPDAIWWAVITVSTVGYGDVVPITVGGKILAGVVVWLGLATIAIMTALITKIFIDHFFGKRMHNCEKCHFPHHDHDAKFCKNCGFKLDTKKLENSLKIFR